MVNNDTVQQLYETLQNTEQELRRDLKDMPFAHLSNGLILKLKETNKELGQTNAQLTAEKQLLNEKIGGMAKLQEQADATGNICRCNPFQMFRGYGCGFGGRKYGLKKYTRTTGERTC